MRHRPLIGFLFLLILLLLIMGNYIHLIRMQRDSNSINLVTQVLKSKFTILIEVDKKQLSLIDRENEQTIKTYQVATGKASSPTPLGSFNISEKASWGEGFGSRWLGLDVPWGIYGIHGTNQPGSIGGNVSGGCIRMQNHDIEELYDLISTNTNVLITNGDYGPFGNDFRVLKPGDRGSDVLEVQKRLSQLGYYKSNLDGIYGDLMKRALINFLRDRNVALTDKITEDIYEKLGIILMD